MYASCSSIVPLEQPRHPTAERGACSGAACGGGRSESAPRRAAAEGGQGHAVRGQEGWGPS
jgi:hypothetical protein